MAWSGTARPDSLAPWIPALPLTPMAKYFIYFFILKRNKEKTHLGLWPCNPRCTAGGAKEEEEPGRSDNPRSPVRPRPPRWGAPASAFPLFTTIWKPFMKDCILWLKSLVLFHYSFCLSFKWSFFSTSSVIVLIVLVLFPDDGDVNGLQNLKTLYEWQANKVMGSLLTFPYQRF